MEELLKNWEREMIRARQEADKQIDEPIARTKAMQKFMCLRDCIKDLKQALDLASVGGSHHHHNCWNCKHLLIDSSDSFECHVHRDKASITNPKHQKCDHFKDDCR